MAAVILPHVIITRSLSINKEHWKGKLLHFHTFALSLKPVIETNCEICAKIIKRSAVCL